VSAALANRPAHPLAALGLPALVIASVAMIVVPLPAPLIDLLVTLDLALSLVVLMTAMVVPGPTQFSAFPSLLLVITFFRLALNIACTRAILLHGHEGTDAAGRVIEAFGQFVVGGSFVVGIVIFLVLVTVQFVVIAHGSTRISEVIARFTLDAMPGKQMAIDADLGAGLITEREAVARRLSIQREAEFFGAMDGAVRFTQRDAVAALLLVAINITAGLAIGIVQLGMVPGEAVRTYTVLTIGDGLAAAIPALLVALAGGIITTRAAQEQALGELLYAQLLLQPRPLKIAAGTLLALALIPGLPKVAFALLAAAVYAGSRLADDRAVEAAEAVPELPAAVPERATEDDVESVPGVDPLCIEVGYDLIAPIGADGPGGILDQIKGLRRRIASEQGFVLPPVRVRDNLTLAPDQYQVLLRGVRIAGGRVPPGRLPGPKSGAVPSPEGEAGSDPASILAAHLTEVVHRNAADLLSRDDVARLLDQLQKTHPRALAELVPERLTVGEVHRVLQGLLREGIPVRDLALIVEAMADAAATTRDTQAIAEAVRRALARPVTAPLVDSAGTLKAVVLSPELEEELTTGLVPDAPGGAAAGMLPVRARDIAQRLGSAVASASASGTEVAIVTGPRLRPFLAQLVRTVLPRTKVLSTLEIPPEVTLRAVGTVS
jgi:flagellar biosynthesis protein FlhA